MAPAARRSGRTSTGAVVVVALLTELVVIGAVGNQWVTERVAHSLTRSFINGGSQGSQDLRAAVLTYNWRLTPQSGDTAHTWLSQVLMILTVLVLTALLVGAVVRGPVTFVRAFAGCWMAVIAATLVGAYVRGFVRNETGSSALRITRAAFGSLGPNSVTMFAALVLGVVVGLAGAIAAVVTRAPAATAEPQAPPAESPSDPPQPPVFFGAPSEHPYTWSPAPRPTTEDQPTTRLGPVEQTTARFPRPPDDDDI